MMLQKRKQPRRELGPEVETAGPFGKALGRRWLSGPAALLLRHTLPLL